MTPSRFPSLTHRDWTVLKTDGPVYPVENITVDNGEDYALAQVTDNTLEGGAVNPAYPWDGRWRIRTPYLGAIAGDDFDSYTNGDAVNGLTGGYAWAGAWVSR